uniref:Uncharacterized protein n=1 Tax=Helianthus annuus TaxID=4232 RepID=A0A251RLX3_HELAN
MPEILMKIMINMFLKLRICSLMIMSVGLDLCFHLRFLSDEEAGCEGANGLGMELYVLI